MTFKSKFFSLLISLVFLLCLLPVAIFTFKNPAYNFDMLGYMALVVRMDQTTDINKIHAITYHQARQLLPAEEYQRLTSTPDFREKFAKDPAEFKKLLPIYAVKPLYLWISWWFYKCGFSLPAATVMPSIFAYLFIGLFLHNWLKKYLSEGMAFLGGLLIMLSLFSVAMAGLSTPDCLSAMFLFMSVYFILEKRNPAWMFIFFLLSIITRVDNIIACFFITTFLAFSEKWKEINRTRYFFMLLILAIAYLFAIFPVTQFGWNIFYYSQYAKQIDFSRDFEQDVSISSYLALVYSKLVTALVSTHFTFFLFLGILIMGRSVSVKKFTFDQSFLLLLLFVIFFRFLLLPDLSDRFYFAFYLVIIILLVRTYSAQISNLGHENH